MSYTGDSRINVRVSPELKARVDHATIDRKTSLTQAVIDAMNLWLQNAGDQSEKTTTREAPTTNQSIVLGYTNQDPILGLVARLLRSDQAEHIRALITYADEYRNNHQSDTLPREDHLAEADKLLAKAQSDAAAAVPGKQQAETPTKKPKDRKREAS